MVSEKKIESVGTSNSDKTKKIYKTTTFLKLIKHSILKYLRLEYLIQDV